MGGEGGAVMEGGAAKTGDAQAVRLVGDGEKGSFISIASSRGRGLGVEAEGRAVAVGRHCVKRVDWGVENGDGGEKR